MLRSVRMREESRLGWRRFGWMFVLLCARLGGAGEVRAADEAESKSEVIRVPVARDSWISAVEGERDGNNGGAARLKFKGIQEFSLLDIDPAALRGQRVIRARLHLRAAGPERLGRVTVSTVAAPWEEGTGSGYARLPGAACFHLPGADPDVTSVILGDGGSIWRFADAGPADANGWQSVAVDPAVIQARLDGRSHGFCVMDDVGNEYSRDGESFAWRLFPNRFFFSREAGTVSAPFFTIECRPQPTDAGAKGDPAPARAGRAPRAGTADGWPLIAPRAPATGAQIQDLFGHGVNSLSAARNETVWVEVTGVIERPVPDVPGCVTRLMPIGAHGDALGSADGTINTDARARWIIEVHIPRDAGPGTRTLEIGGGVGIPIRIWNFTLPDELSFVPQLNAYDLPRQHEIEYYRLAHRYRACLNCLRYSWRGHVAEGAAPTVSADGTWDWREWDARFGPLLDGSAFADLPRSGVPVDNFYLPLNENWPMDHDRFFRGGYWIESAYDPAYWEGFRAAAAAFAGHIADRQWTSTRFEFYLNNKVYFKSSGAGWGGSSAAWIFDEPVNTQDFWALRRFGIEFNRAARALAPNALFRCDISRPEWQRDLLDGVTGEEIIGGALRRYAGRIMDRRHRWGHLVSMYGSAAAPGPVPIQPAAWCLDAWCLGADGVVPWQTIGSAESWKRPDALSVIYRSADGPVPSRRLLAFAAGQQLVEYLTLVSREPGMTRESLAAFVRRHLSLNATHQRGGDEDAGTMIYDETTADRMASLREFLGERLDARAPSPERRLVDLRPPVVAEGALPGPFLVAGEPQPPPPPSPPPAGTDVRLARARISVVSGAAVVDDALVEESRADRTNGREPRDNRINRGDEASAFLVRFKLPPEPAAKTIIKARLDISIWDPPSRARMRVGAFPLTSDWTEQSVAWVNRPEWAAKPRSSAVIEADRGADVADPPMVTSFDLDPADLEHGVALVAIPDRSVDDGHSGRCQVIASEHPRAEFGPRLTLWYAE